MNSIQLVAPRRLESREMPMPPDPAAGEVLVRLRAVGICGSDMHWYKEGGIGSSLASYPQVLGHEPAGEIVAVGKGVDGIRIGQRVAVEPAITCGHCEFCRSGHHNNCVTSIFMGSPQMPGLFRDYAVMPKRNVVPIPDSMSFAAATILEPLAVILHILELVDIRLGDTVAVMGAGPVGLLTASVARVAGASRIFIADKLPHRLRMARDMGFDCAIEIGKFQQAVMDETRGRGVDIVLDAAAALETINMSIAIARLGGRVVLIGIPSEANLNIDVHTAMAKELNIQTVKRSNHNAHGALELMESGRIGDQMVTHRMPLEKTPEAFEILAEYAGGVGKVVIEIP
jgi:L-iditol 2-dehydrogenase